MDELQRLRGEIDLIDKEIIELFEKRMSVVLGVAEYKKTHNAGVLQTSREDEVLQKAVDNLKDKGYADSARELMRMLMDLSKDLQRKKVKEGVLLKQYDRKPLDRTGKRGYYGDVGSNSQQAMADFFGDSDGMSFPTFEDVFIALKNDVIKYGVLPIENSSTGAITEVYDLLRKYDFFVVGEQWQGINHCLLGVEGARIDDIKEVYSHPQALTQCDSYLSGGKWKIIPYKSTASSAKLISEQGDKSKAAIASVRNAQLYNLSVLAENIQSQYCNCTRFIVIAKNMLESVDSDKTSIVFALNSTPGALFNALKVFAKNRINLINIQSRPVENTPERYYFYVDLEYPCNCDKLSEALEYVASVSSFFEIIGQYGKKSWVSEK